MRHKRSATHPAAAKPTPSRRIQGVAECKPPDGAVCPHCKASHHRGRWTWRPASAGSHDHVCPACERIAAGYPAGVLHVGGEFAVSHREELVGLLRNIEERERIEHPMKRIMAIADEGPGFVVTVTDAKLALTFGRSLKKAYAGNLEQPPTSSDRENLVRVHWARG